MKRILCQGDYFKQVLAVIKNGGVVALPTETVYGFSCDPSNPLAVKKFIRLKEENSIIR